MFSIVKYSLLGFPLASAGLGVWQIKRLEWKTKLIEELDKQIREPPVDLMEINSAQDVDELEYRRVKTRGRYDPDPTHQLFMKPRGLVVNDEALLRGKTAHQSNNGMNVITPFTVEGTNLRILVNRGWIPLRGEDVARIGLDSSEPFELIGVVRKSDKRKSYGVKNDVTRNEWHIRDIDAMAKALQTAPIYLDADSNPKQTQGPIAGQTQLNVRNEHLNYAITWFSLAVLSYVMWHTKYGRGWIKRRRV